MPLAMVVRLGVWVETDSLPVRGPTTERRITYLKKAYTDSNRADKVE